MTYIDLPVPTNIVSMTTSLYDRLGADQLDLLVDAFYSRVQQDDRINHLFKDDFATIKGKQRLFLTQFLGGPVLYTEQYGHPRMRARHMPHQITADGAYAWLENMSAAIDTLDITQDLKVELLQRFPHVAAHMVNT